MRLNENGVSESRERSHSLSRWLRASSSSWNSVMCPSPTRPILCPSPPRPILCPSAPSLSLKYSSPSRSGLYPSPPRTLFLNSPPKFSTNSGFSSSSPSKSGLCSSPTLNTYNQSTCLNCHRHSCSCQRSSNRWYRRGGWHDEPLSSATSGQQQNKASNGPASSVFSMSLRRKHLPPHFSKPHSINNSTHKVNSPARQNNHSYSNGNFSYANNSVSSNRWNNNNHDSRSNYDHLPNGFNTLWFFILADILIGNQHLHLRVLSNIIIFY